jgi:ligand-binding sensor domain-containing protein
MKFIKTIHWIFLISIAIPSCIGKGKSDTKSKEPTHNSVGKFVSKIAPNTHLMYQDKKHNYWFVNDSMVYKYDEKILLQFTQEDGLVSNRIIGIQEDQLGNIYFDTPEGVSKFDGKQFETLKISSDNFQKNNWKSEPNDLWFRIGWDKKGPYRFDGKYLYHLEFPKSKMEEELYTKYPEITYNPYSIYSMYKDSKDFLWFGTADLGIYQFDGKKISWMYEEHLGTTPEGGAFGIRSIMEDKEGYFWICNANYKYRILSNSEDKTSQLSSINYTREKGLVNKSAETLYLMSMLVDDKGTLWMVNNDGIWKRNDQELIPFLIKNGKGNISPISIYQDHQGDFWLGTKTDGIYKYDGVDFKKVLFNKKDTSH